MHLGSAWPDFRGSIAYGEDARASTARASQISDNYSLVRVPRTLTEAGGTFPAAVLGQFWN